MAILQDSQPELRYLKRKNLEQEAQVVGNYYRDLIRSYGIDCNYYKLDTSIFEHHKDIVDRNSILRHAYGYDDTPDYSVSAEMIGYMEVEQDIFQLNKNGLVPNIDTNFYFDSIDFACALAEKCGQYKEYPLDEIDIVCEVPDLTHHKHAVIDPFTHKVTGLHDLSADLLPYQLGLGYKENYTAGCLSGKLSCQLGHYEIGKPSHIVCDAYQHSDFTHLFPVNSELYKSFMHKIANSQYIDTDIRLDYTVQKTKVDEQLTMLSVSYKPFDVEYVTDKLKMYKLRRIERAKLDTFEEMNMYFYEIEHVCDDIGLKCKLADVEDVSDQKKLIEIRMNAVLHELGIEYKHVFDISNAVSILDMILNRLDGLTYMQSVEKCILTGKIHGNILFYDIHQIGKYAELIHPSVGDVITIDFPDELHRERYEITDCFDKNLQTDGISPLLHKYIWKCKARKYVNPTDQAFPEQSQDDDRMLEKQQFEAQALEHVAKTISLYDTLSGNIKEDAVYGGYDYEYANYDSQESRTKNAAKQIDILAANEALDIHIFNCGSKLVTNGYDLMYVTADDECFMITTLQTKHLVDAVAYETGNRWLKANDESVVFVNLNGDSTRIVCDEEASVTELQSCLNSLYDLTIQPNPELNNAGDSFLKFNGSRTYLWATNDHLYAHLQSNNRLYKIV